MKFGLSLSDLLQHSRDGDVVQWFADVRQRFPDEAPFVYQPFAASVERHVWSAQAKAGLRDYTLLDLSI